MADVPGATVRDTGRTKCGIVTFDIVGHEARELKRQLREMAINVSVTVPSTTLLDARARSLPDLLRASVHYFNAEEEIERFVGAITQIVS
jgi:selenocysteine lyase/cysteine desulfurase